MLPRLEGTPIGASLLLADVLANLPFDQQGLVAAVAQQFDSREVLPPMNNANADLAARTSHDAPKY